MSSDRLTIAVETTPQQATLDVIDNGLDSYNAQFSAAPFEEFVVALKTATDDAGHAEVNGEVKGGIYAQVWAGMLTIKWVWIDAPLRGQGHGQQLMLTTEAEGRRRGCSAVWLDTFEFQARPFYEKLGYATFSELDYPAGFKRYFMKKNL